ncbi:exodeoxyribonuclease VII large subunit [Stenotrophomonas phage vB_SmaS-DLP_6]|nr:exodeoxyribonuclease VII large subunit [Stenotrophomonas phage vB_SmaS-DLP_6]
MKISKSLMDAVVGALSEPVNVHSPRGNEVTEAWKNNYKYAQRSPGHSSGRHYTDAHGVRHDDEGYSSDGNGPADRREREMHKPAAKPAAVKHYHEVPYAKKEEAKGEGMKWHAEKKKWYHTDAGKSATSKFKKLHEEVDQIDEETESLEEAFLELSKGHPAEWHKKQAEAHPEGSLGHHLHMSSYHSKSGNSAESEKHDDKALAIREKIAAKYGKGAHQQRAYFATKLDEDTIEEGWKEYSGDESGYRDLIKKHHPDAKAGRGHAEGITQHTVGSQDSVVGHYDSQHKTGKVKVYEEVNEELFNEENGHATRKAAEGRLEALEKKHPLAKHSVIQGRRTGRWHVVRHTSGGQHIVEALSEDCGLDSKSDWKGYKSKADKKKSDGIDDDGGDKKPKDNIKEGDESEADYQAYLKSLKGNKDKKLSTIKSVRGGK